MAKRKPKKAIYARVSKKNGVQKTKNQIIELKEKFPGATVYQEKGSATTGELPVQKKLIAELQRGDTLIVWSVDRLGRSVPDLSTLYKDLNDRGIELYSDKENFDVGTPSGLMVAHVVAALAQNEVERSSQRIKAGLKRAVSEGKTLGRPPGFSPTLQEIESSRMGGMMGRKDAIEGFPDRVIRLRKMGISYQGIADLMRETYGLQIGKSTIRDYVKKYEKDGSLPPAIVKDEAMYTSRARRKRREKMRQIQRRKEVQEVVMN